MRSASTIEEPFSSPLSWFISTYREVAVLISSTRFESFKHDAVYLSNTITCISHYRWTNRNTAHEHFVHFFYEKARHQMSAHYWVVLHFVVQLPSATAAMSFFHASANSVHNLLWQISISFSYDVHSSNNEVVSSIRNFISITSCKLSYSTYNFVCIRLVMISSLNEDGHCSEIHVHECFVGARSGYDGVRELRLVTG